MKKLLFAILLILYTCATVSAAEQYTMSYRVVPDMENHYLNVELTMKWAEQQPSAAVMLKMPVWAPGYYIVVDYPKYVTDFSVSDAEGKPVKWQKEGKSGWQFVPVTPTMTVRYRIYANMHSVAECYVNDTEAFIAPNGVYMYVDGDKQHAVSTTYVMPNGWQQASTSLDPVGENKGIERTFAAPDFDVLYDSPVLLGNHMVHKFTHEGHDYEMAILTPEGYDESGFEDDFKKMVSANTKLIGDVPYKRYCLIHLGAGGGGLEHLSSQACYTSGTYRFNSRNSYLRHLSFVSHEYFHLYNVKSIRPYELGPFDYEHEVFTPLLWVSEGFTCYYETKNLLRAGIIDRDYILDDLASTIKTVETAEGHKHMSLRQSSYDIWLNFFNNAGNHRDVTISYYDKGPVFGLFFDIEIARLSGGKHTLDDLMRLLYYRYYKELGRGFTEEKFWSAADEVAGGSLSHLRHYVDSTDDIDYDKLFSHAGLYLDREEWKIRQVKKPTASQKKLLEVIL